MSNMSYCRFENTVSDLQDCYDNFDAVGLSETEKRARKNIIRLAISIANDYSYEIVE